MTLGQAERRVSLVVAGKTTIKDDSPPNGATKATKRIQARVQLGSFLVAIAWWWSLVHTRHCRLLFLTQAHDSVWFVLPGRASVHLFHPGTSSLGNLSAGGARLLWCIRAASRDDLVHDLTNDAAETNLARRCK
jgi:hypothetical protein